MKLSNKTENFLLSNCPEFVAKLESPNSYEAVKKQAATGLYIVFAGGSSDNIFSSDNVRNAYRAWHDSIHISFNLDFSKESEFKVATLQKELALNSGVNERDAILMELDLSGHVAHFYKYNEHPDEQTDYLNELWYNYRKSESIKQAIEDTLSNGKIY